jgi:hypothetical protein
MSQPSKQRRIFRKVVGIQEWNGSRTHSVLTLECGHWTETHANKRIPQKKACCACELIAAFRDFHPGEYQVLLRLLRRVPLDDAPQALLNWVIHLHEMQLLETQVPGLSIKARLLLTQEPTSYPLARYLGDDDWNDKVTA